MAIFIGITLANIKGMNNTRCKCSSRVTYLMLYPTGLPVISTSNGCYYKGIFSISAFFWLPALVYEPILFFMVLWKAREEDWLDYFRGWGMSTVVDKGFSPGKLVKAFARDRYAASGLPEPNNLLTVGP